jgi:hypothetical protein
MLLALCQSEPRIDQASIACFLMSWATEKRPSVCSPAADATMVLASVVLQGE